MRGYSAETADLRRPSKRRKVRHCEICNERLPADRWGRCFEHANDASYDHGDDMQTCICWATDFSGRSVCGFRCPMHIDRLPDAPPGWIG
jgi:hypothetical protein